MTVAHRRLPEWQMYDEIKISTNIRRKESELSGDEFRISVVVKAYFKGHEVKSLVFSDMPTSLQLLYARLYHPENEDGAIPKEIVESDKIHCDQPGCPLNGNRFFWIKQLFAKDGSRIDSIDYKGIRYYRRFCDQHADRGDCDREDCNDNMIEFNGAELFKEGVL